MGIARDGLWRKKCSGVLFKQVVCKERKKEIERGGESGREREKEGERDVWKGEGEME